MDNLPQEILCRILNILSSNLHIYAPVCRLWADILTLRRTTQVIHCETHSLMLHTYTYDKLSAANKGELWIYYYYYCNNSEDYLDIIDTILASYCKRFTAKFTFLPSYIVQVPLVCKTVTITLYAKYDKVQYSIVTGDSFNNVYKSTNYINILLYLNSLILCLGGKQSSDSLVTYDDILSSKLDDFFESQIVHRHNFLKNNFALDYI